MLAIYKRDLKAYFYSPIAYVLMAMFVLMSSILFYLMNIAVQNAELSGTLANIAIILIVVIPILTMRLLAEERKNGTEVLLVTSPIRITDIVVGKFFAAYTVFLAMSVINLIFAMFLYQFGEPTTPQLVGSLFGFLLLGGAFVAIGLFCSSITENQIVAAVCSFTICLAMWFLQMASVTVGGFLGQVFSWISLLNRFTGFAQGRLELSAIVYYLTVTVLFLYFTVRIIEKKRWSKG